ncbi:hypothetical protein SBA5_970001 [Candidatus Sulfotelmatomonas gaucii]|uniref:Uncharacterized protein n=1 Tax=Candidatus Sulfuritelmatomonas gaucii TaxID=2043161 RepID=A0A2N9M9Y4_9BACT|nr:hypothetical protein SBA5_970001 [Candidatus Sulfotelmatomonas gaucii]
MLAFEHLQFRGTPAAAIPLVLGVFGSGCDDTQQKSFTSTTGECSYEFYAAWRARALSYSICTVEYLNPMETRFHV